MGGNETEILFRDKSLVKHAPPPTRSSFVARQHRALFFFAYHLCRMNVAGPSFTRSTCIEALKLTTFHMDAVFIPEKRLNMIEVDLAIRWIGCIP